MKLQYTFTRQFFLQGFPLEPLLAPRPHRGGNPPALPHVEECTLFQGVKSSWGINMVENKDL
jgi:hypothetical protein